MSNPWTGMVAKSITSNKRPRSFWNAFFSIALLITIIGMVLCTYHIVADRIEIEVADTYLKYDNGSLYTVNSTYSIPDIGNQNININVLRKKVSSGDPVLLTVSKITGDLLSVQYRGEVIYEKAKTPIIPAAIAFTIAISFFVFMLVVTNIKHPNKFVDKVQRGYLLRIYK